MEHVIIGNSAAAIGAIESIRKVDQNSSLTVVSNENEHVYSRPLIAHYLAGDVTEDRMPYRPEDFYRKNRVTTHLGTRVTEVDPIAEKLCFEDGSTLKYDRLLISTGSKVSLPPLPGCEDFEGINIFQSYNDAKRVLNRLEKGRKAVVIGAGLIGLRAAYGLQAAGADVTLIELLPRIASRILDKKGSRLVQKILENGGIKVFTGCSVKEIIGTKSDGVTGVILGNDEKIDSNVVIMSTGVTPNTTLAENTPLEVNLGLVVNRYFQTSFSNIFAAGDVAETFDIPRGAGMVNANWPNAYEQGRYAGLCMTGEMKKYPGSVGMNSVSFYKMPVISMGLFDPETEGVEGTEIKIRENLKNNIYQKLIFKNNILKGAILIGDIGYAGTINDLIRAQVLVGVIKDSILEEKYQLYNFLRKKRRDKVEGTAIQWPETHSSTSRYEKSFNEETWTEREQDKRIWR